MSTSTSEPQPDRAYAWVWLPGDTEPVPAGVVVWRGGLARFAYGEQYLARPEAISLWSGELPLRPGFQEPAPGHAIASCLRDAAPDAWGRRVILDRVTQRRGRDADPGDLSELTYLLESASDRIGALDFQARPDEYVPRRDHATLDQLHEAARLVDQGEPLPPALRAALVSGTGVGGARPKALVTDADGGQWVAKFSTSDDPFDVVGAEAASTWLAAQVGIDVPQLSVVTSLGRTVLLTRRFDRPDDGTRRGVLSALTFTGRTESVLHRGSYLEILDALRRHPGEQTDLGRALFTRVAFAMAITNTDDHLRNHAAFWDGHQLDLTPAYDLSPGVRSGDSADLAIAYGRDGRRQARFASLVEVAGDYGLTRPQARTVIDTMIDTIRTGWAQAADVARLTAAEREGLWGRQILHPAVLYDYPAHP